ncbi:LPS export ABC transporter permease LptF [Gluconacetobacter azotocaptans]|uniref:LPS export ABC transporter permease LptF n=1 Tax=Gluconacetobacter azotocaptans TaxID=142834 RepID=A0A7W4PEU8_9PROT|nr:LPS export ABC transporter permease LptF [Gluconacetobacter azotocaptans]MBB2189914.1 LPS export ABC transporter permease LptF [Gluconacetobacter azotocaptans]MBM9403339.1 LPS export ABC transporter permease LptF [Gluconacetobacter azotocaptans]
MSFARSATSLPPRSRLPMLDRYVLRQLLLALVATTGGLSALIWLTQSLRFVSLVVERGLSLRVFIGLTGLLVPSFVAVILPITTFVVVQFVYQRLAGDRELTVMRAAGLSPFFIARPGLLCTGMSVAACFLLNLWIVPMSYHAFRQYEFQIRNRMAAFMLQEGVFTPVSDTMTVYIRTRDRDGTLHGIMVEDDRQPTSQATILAEHGTMLVIDNQPRVVLFNGSREEIDRKTGRLNVLTFQRNTIDLTSSHGDQARFRDATELSLHELLHPNPLEVSSRDRGKFAVEAWRRLTTPFTAFSFAMIGLFSVLRGAFSRHGSILRPAVAIMSVVGLLALSLLVQNLASRNTGLIPLMWIEAIVPGVACAVILFLPEWRCARQRHAGLPGAMGPSRP